jgi:hypothetical protein
VCYYRSSFDLIATNNGESSELKYSTEDSYVHYCYMINNFANYWGCIYFNYYKHTCEESNIINNSQVSSGGGILNNQNSAIVIINKCCLIKNNEIGSANYLIWVNDGTMYVKECKIQNGYSYKNNGAFYTSYSNTVAGSECVAISNCGANLGNNKDENKSKIVQCKVITIIASHQQALVTK